MKVSWFKVTLDVHYDDDAESNLDLTYKIKAFTPEQALAMAGARAARNYHDCKIRSAAVFLIPSRGVQQIKGELIEKRDEKREMQQDSVHPGSNDGAQAIH